MEWFVDYLEKSTLDDLKREPLAWEERKLYLEEKYNKFLRETNETRWAGKHSRHLRLVKE